ncbi:MAG: LysM peptidoglycan-binding domain-containing protein [Bacteroidia bacterium]|nr:LysM peptidoglycan-binding domain-containing protein [Bacteroidia bacterium]
MLHKTAILIFTFILACAYAQTPETYTVKRGDNLFRISQKYGMSVEELKRRNNLRGSNIVVGQKLNVSSTIDNPRISSRGLDAGEDISEGPRTYYRVRRGDDIYSIASEFGVLVDEIREWNSISQVRTGQTIIVGKNDVARVPAFGMAPKEDRYEDSDSYRRRGPSTTLVRKNSQDRNDSYRTNRNDSYRRSNESNSSSSRSRISDYRERDARENNSRRSSRDTYEKNYDDRTNDYRRYDDNDRNSSSRQSSSSYDDRYEDDRYESSNARFSEDRNKRYNDERYEDDYDNSRMPRAADIKYGSRVAAIYEPYEEVSSGRRVAKDFEEEKTSSYTESYNKRNRNKGRITGDFTELKSNKAGRNRFYAFHDSLPLGTRIKMEIPNNSGFIEVEVIDRLPTYERVMIGLSPACVAVLEGAGSTLDEVTIIAE